MDKSNHKLIGVIPARAGSKGIPNKNLRLINNKPLIYYTIKKALDSKYISEIIVSTDSDEIKVIAKQMGVSIKERRPELSSDNVTLDPVIYDAVEDKEFNSVVTLQPTSPLLKTQTLDKAFEYFLDSNLDTLISAYNNPHLAWKERPDGSKYPDYEKRLNRQMLPPYYVEAGAFLFTRKEVISKNSRIGKNVDIYEISQEESIDIDTFADLKYCEEILSKKKIAFYVNGNNKRGIGHIYRSLELTDEFYSHPDIYYDINQTDKKYFGKTTHHLIGVDGLQELFNKISKKKYDIFINDILNTSIDYMIALKRCHPSKKIINFEDTGEGVVLADLVINALYDDPMVPQMKSGEKYYICNKTFLFYNPIKIKENIVTVFISFGGADPQNYTDRLLEIISKPKYKKYQFIVVLGRAKKNVKELMSYNKHNNIEVYFDILNMPELMSRCDIAFTSRGRTGYELAILGIPTIAMAQNHREEKHGFVNHENGFNYLGLNPSNKIIETNLNLYLTLSSSERKKIQNLLLKHDLKNGRKRVINLINSL